MAQLLKQPPEAVSGVAVAGVDDFTSRAHLDADGTRTPLPLPSANMLRLTLKNGAWIVVRPSGTEPKLKLYIGANAKTEPAVDKTLHDLMTDMDARLSALLR